VPIPLDLFRPYLDKPDALGKAAQNGSEGERKSEEELLLPTQYPVRHS
jgi:hypothetical protein